MRAAGQAGWKPAWNMRAGLVPNRFLTDLVIVQGIVLGWIFLYA